MWGKIMTKDKAAVAAHHSAIGIIVLALLYCASGLFLRLFIVGGNVGSDIFSSIFIITPALLVAYFIYRYKSRFAAWVAAIPAFISIVFGILLIASVFIVPTIALEALSYALVEPLAQKIAWILQPVIALAYTWVSIRAIKSTHKYHKL
jgi:hypothetical protein